MRIRELLEGASYIVSTGNNVLTSAVCGPAKSCGGTVLMKVRRHDGVDVDRYIALVSIMCPVDPSTDTDDNRDSRNEFRTRAEEQRRAYDSAAKLSQLGFYVIASDGGLVIPPNAVEVVTAALIAHVNNARVNADKEPTEDELQQVRSCGGAGMEFVKAVRAYRVRTGAHLSEAIRTLRERANVVEPAPRAIESIG